MTNPAPFPPCYPVIPLRGLAILIYYSESILPDVYIFIYVNYSTHLFVDGSLQSDLLFLLLKQVRLSPYCICHQNFLCTRRNMRPHYSLPLSHISGSSKLHFP